MRSLGLQPDLIACRCSKALDTATINKIALYCDVEPSQVLSVVDQASLYHVPLLLESQGLIRAVSEDLRLDRLTVTPSLMKRGDQAWNAWKELTYSQDHLYKSVCIALCGKYTDHPDSYHSVVKALEHASMACSRKLKIITVNAEHLEDATKSSSPKDHYKAWQDIHTADGVLIPGGFGERGCEGMISAIKACREEEIPFLGICLGLQLATIEFARHECNLPLAASAEFNAEAAEPLVIHMPEIDKKTMGATMRLGLRPTMFQAGSEWSKVYKIYRYGQSPSLPAANGINGDIKPPSVNGSANDISTANGAAVEVPPPSTEVSPLTINERHRHRYEVNPAYVEQLEEAGLSFVGRDEFGQRMEILELKDHKYFVGVQFHPEYLSRVLKPSKPFLGFVAASAGMLPEVLSGKRQRASSTGYAAADLADGIGGVRIQDRE